MGTEAFSNHRNQSTFTAGSAQFDGPKTTSAPEIQEQYEGLERAIKSLDGEVALLNERLGYISTPAPVPGCGETEGSPQPNRSPLAHNLYCASLQVNSLAYRLQVMRNSLEI